MGQVQATPTPDNSAKDFVNFPKQAIESLWTSYNLNGEGWGLNEDDFLGIVNGAPVVTANYKFSENHLKNLFRLFDTDNNGLVDAIELLLGVALVSGVQTLNN